MSEARAHEPGNPVHEGSAAAEREVAAAEAARAAPADIAAADDRAGGTAGKGGSGGGQVAGDGVSPRRRQRLRRAALVAGRVLDTYVFSSLTRRIVVLNLFALVALVSGILYLNQFRAGLIDARVESLLTQGEIIAAAIAGSASAAPSGLSIDPDRLLQLQAREPQRTEDEGLNALDFPINPERVAPILRRLISPTKTRARIYDRDGVLLLDSRHLYARGQILRFDAQSQKPDEPGIFDSIWDWMQRSFGHGGLSLYVDLGAANGKGYPEIERALAGVSTSVVRLNEAGETVISVAVPVQRLRTTLGALLLSTQGSDIETILHNERMAIVRVFIVASSVTVVLSMFLAGTIAGPMRRLAAAADRVRRGARGRESIPDFPDRHDEIGHLARALREMTEALYRRMDAIEAFAADVSHELKNPLTSLRSAVETLPLAKSETARNRLLEIIQHDVRRLNRLITDISDASRLDAELSRQDAGPVDLARLVEMIVEVQRSLAEEDGPRLTLTVAAVKGVETPYMVFGHASRLGQVFTNLIDNARSFSRPGGEIRVAARRDGPMVEVVIDDDGPGIRAEDIDRIFERFYTDRPEGEGFGNNSGLGLSISRQIVEAHGGTLRAENRRPDGDPGGAPVGARFIVRLPASGERQA